MSNWDYGYSGSEETSYQATPEHQPGQSELLNAERSYRLRPQIGEQWVSPYQAAAMEALDFVVGDAYAQPLNAPPGYYEGGQSVAPEPSAYAGPFNMETEARALEQFNTPPNSGPAPSPPRPPPGIPPQRFRPGGEAGGPAAAAKYVAPTPGAWPPPGAASRDADQRDPGVGGAPPQPGDGGQRGAPPAGGGGGYYGAYGLPPIQVPYSPYESEAELHAEYQARRDGLQDMLKVDVGGQMRTVTGPEGPFGQRYKDYQAALQALNTEEVAATEHFVELQDSIDGDVLALGRHQMAMQSDQAELQAREHEMGAGVLTDRAAEAKKAEQKLERSAQKAAARRNRVNASIEGEMQAFKQAIKSIENTKIDPDRWWKEKGTWGQVGYLISMALASVGNAAVAAVNVGSGGQRGPVGGGGSFGAIESRIDRDIQAQIQDLENKKTGLAGRTTLIGMMRDQLGDVDRAEAAAKALIYEKLELRARAIEDFGQSAIMKNRALGLRMWAGGKKQEYEMQASLQARARAENMERQRAMAFAMAGAMRQQDQTEAEEMAALEEQGLLLDPKQLKDEGLEYVHAAGGLVEDMSDSERAAFVEMMQAGKEVETLANELIQLRKGKRGWDNYQQVEQKTEMLRQKIRAAGNSKFFDSDKDAASNEKQVPNVNNPTVNDEVMLGNIVTSTQRARHQRLAAYNVNPAQRVQVPVRDPRTGRLKRNPDGTPVVTTKFRTRYRRERGIENPGYGTQYDPNAVPYRTVDPSRYEEPPGGGVYSGAGSGSGAQSEYIGGQTRPGGAKVYR